MIGDKGRREKAEGDDDIEGFKSNPKSPNNRKTSEYSRPYSAGGPELYDDIVFQGYSSDFCVCMLDIVDSTAVTSSLAHEDKIRKFYSLFVNSVSPVISRFGGRVLKTGGDSLIYYFPRTAEEKRIEGFTNLLECGISLLDLRGTVNGLYKKEGIHPIGYRISADYGRLELAESRFSRDQDFFGPTMNLCAKINNKAPANSMVIGGDLHQMVKNLRPLEKQFQFQEISEFSIGLKQRYPIHLVVPVNFNSRDSYPELKELILHQHDIRTQKEPPLERINFSPEIPPRLGVEGEATFRGNIMLVDDQPDMLFTYRSFLEGKGFTVDSFTDPTVALKMFAKEDSTKYDLVVMDIRMPHLNGLQLYQRLKAINSQIRILFVTALDAADELISLLPDVEATQVIMKPVTRDRFLSHVDLAVREKG
jgi:two-component system, OmpR family, response regulator ChvI